METVQENSVNLIKTANSGSILPSSSVAQSPNTTNSNLSDNKTPNKQGRPLKSQSFTSEATLNNRNMLEYLKRKREDTALDPEHTEDTETASQATKKQNMLQLSSTKAQDTPVCLENKSTDEILRILVSQIGAVREEAKTNKTSLENRIQQSQSENKKSIQALRKDYQELKSTWSDKWTKMQERQAKLEAEIAELKAAKTNTEHTRLEKENNSCIEEINSKIKCLEDMTEIYEKSWRKLNIIVKNHNWPNSNLLNQAQEFFNRNFNLNNPVSEIKPLDRNFKILRIKLADENTKAIILKNKALNLKESKISIMQDLTKRELQTFKKLQQVAREQKELAWNVRGIQNLWEADNLVGTDIICACETWATHANELPPNWNKYSALWSPAIKEKSTGHASGGIIILAKKPIKIKEIFSSDSWIFAHITAGSSRFILASVYIRPSRDMKTSMDLLQDSINDIDQLYGNLPMLLVGDFNARLGALSPIQEELVTNTNIYATREASDEEINTRGRTLDNAMTESSLIVINGRSFSDRPSKHTCLHINKSTIDFVWANVSALSIIYDLEILQIENPSDHFPLLLQLYYDEPPLTQATIENKNREMFQWTSTGEDEYRARMTWSDKVALINNDNLDEINNILITENKIAAEAAGMKKQLKGLHRLKRSQLWYDDECKQGKQELAKLFKSYKKAGFQGQAKELYVQAKKKQKALVKRKKQQVREQQLNNLANTNKPSDFWKTVSRFKSHPGTGKNPISIQAWENFYENNIPNREEDTTTYYGVLDPNLDCEFTLSELNRVLNKSKSNKATGPDGVKNEHLKNLPENWKLTNHAGI
ncbi:Protein of unknown function [Cotesia congregata]|uniref:Endonuclease/exonuclease/phosphatase domain-containing protein n=1 Tax=Cotesia congregata TaxID=51543 RepID=A0A8J2MK72_COTCN|nr:Protein of unknown function [Cotesia congregata]